MKILLIKRLESSFFAFKNSLNRFIASYERFLEELDSGKIYVSKKYTNKIYELIENDEEEKIQEFLDTDKARVFPAEDFKKELKRDLLSDLEMLKDVRNQWEGIRRDPKLMAFIDILESKTKSLSKTFFYFTPSLTVPNVFLTPKIRIWG